MNFDGPTLLGIAAIITPLVGTLNLVITLMINSRQSALKHEMNSVRDALVASTAKASHAEGMADQQAATAAATKARQTP